MGILNIASIFLVLVFLASTVSFLAYIFRRKNGRKTFAAYAVGVGILGFAVYLLNVFGIIPTPLPSGVGRLVVISLAIIFGIISIAIWRW